MSSIADNSPTNLAELFSSELRFNELYPQFISELSRRHWTPLLIAKKASDFLATGKGARILDIGSGVGKFCLTAAYYHPECLFYGVEQRKELIGYAESVCNRMELKNVFFLHGNFTQLDFKKYDHFYFYNSFYENVAGTETIDDNIAYSAELYHYYNRYLYSFLQHKPSGTRIATYHSLEDEIPPEFHVVGSEVNNLLKYWIKE